MILNGRKKQDFLSNSRCFFSENNSQMLDHTIMTLCDYFILSRGTFAWWAVYLSKTNKKVFYSNEFIDTIYNGHFDDYYLDDWVHVKDNWRYLKIQCSNDSNITIKDDFDLINYYSYGNITFNIETIKQLFVKSNKNMWKFNINNVEGSFVPMDINKWQLSINNTRKLVGVLSLGDDSSLELYQHNEKKIITCKNKIYIFPSYVMFKCENASIFYATGDTFK